MLIGVPKEIKPQENRIGLTPESVKTLVSEGHEVLVEKNGGLDSYLIKTSNRNLADTAIKIKKQILKNYKK